MEVRAGFVTTWLKVDLRLPSSRSAQQICARKGEKHRNPLLGDGWSVDQSSKRKFASKSTNEERKHVLVAKWGGLEIGRSRQYLVLGGNFFFPQEHVRLDAFEEATEAVGWKRRTVSKQHNPIGRAIYYDILVRDDRGKPVRRNRAAAWTFPTAKGQWKPMENYWGFWKGVEFRIEKDDPYPGSSPGGYF
uniref:DUF427 domain-containing protein n=1 Tax=Rhodosorus marinus TaxID=101924 RepID=A0A7S2ZZ49_9RHOD|mmetsp:Transcript_38435/g.151739  ORF Transcript_38435/g.151739 Transcript_38435/m.151739 type:complete len:190 (+) Transcript_38435:410-979(+)|eukprot:CAMPEP_0113961044 /NCGR_PEP_ID=MMETSP0011_2-20120614/5074_1 /TAXON_ID=101924 /ORGANISM="Rhodosorus marinus" /LENGTH=189 /DNA_ID=CAMNT_0000972609 /DNA_START=285 /DNA_END=854 /DNA_ORIENTATION=- /assembly_acc=CAM_ASM_000156